MAIDLNDNEREIRRLAALTVAAGPSTGRTTAILGAGSSIAAGVPSWRGVCEILVAKLHLRGEPDDDPIGLVQAYFATASVTSYERFWAIYPELAGFSPSAGHAHLAHLVKQGYIGLILTTNWDPLIEIALSRVLRPDQYRVMVRGEIPDGNIARSLRTSTLPTVLKLHGDLSARLFHVVGSEMPPLGADLSRAVAGLTKADILVLGSSLEDPDLINLLTSEDMTNTIYYASPDAPSRGSTVQAVLRGNPHHILTGPQGTFDAFMTKLNLAIQREALGGERWAGVVKQREMIAALERGASTVSYNTVAHYVKDFARRIMAREPDLIAYVHDRRAPGGTEIRRRLMDTEIGTLPQLQIPIESDLNNRGRQPSCDLARRSWQPGGHTYYCCRLGYLLGQHA